MSIRPHMRGLKEFTDDMVSNSEDSRDVDIDFQSAGLYLVGLQVVFATVTCAVSSILSCWLLPERAVSAVRTLAVTGTVGMLIVLHPIRVGRVRGVTTLFNALRPSVLLYVQALVIEQLVHTCVPADARVDPGTWRRVIFHLMCLTMVFSGFVRAHRPRSETDLPFCIALVALLVVAILPPPAKPLTGPLCSPSSMGGAGERVARALLYSALYVTHVYAAAPRRNAMNELVLCVVRSYASSLWVLGATAWVLPLAVVQLGMCLWAVLNSADVTSPKGHGGLPMPMYNHTGYATTSSSYEPLDTRSDGGSDIEGGHNSHRSPMDAATAAYLAATQQTQVPTEMMSIAEGEPQEETAQHSNPLSQLPAAHMSLTGSRPHGTAAARAAHGSLRFNLGSVSGGQSTSPLTVSADQMAEIASRM